MLESSVNMADFALILASGSPRRKELFALFDIPFFVSPPEIDETQGPNEPARDYVWRLAHEKGWAVAQRSSLPVLSADTTVVFEEKTLGKPANRAEAIQMLTSMRAKWHRVFTAVSIMASSSNLQLERLVESKVLMRKYSDTELSQYIDTGSWQDKAGGYAIQDAVFKPCDDFKGSFTNIMGLPMEVVSHMLMEAGFMIPTDISDRIDSLFRISSPYLTKATHERII